MVWRAKVSMKTNLTPAELDRAQAYAQKIDLNNSAVIMQYAAPVQRRITSFSGQALEIATSQASNDAISIINQLIEQIQTFSKAKRGFLGLGKMSTEDWREEYQGASQTIKALSLQLEQIQFQLYKDMGLYQEMAKRNQAARQELQLYLSAGQHKLQLARSQELPRLEANQQVNGQLQLNHYRGQVEQFEKKLQDLEVTRIIADQFESQLQLMHQTAQTLTDRLQATIQHTIPLWQNQVSIALGLDRIKQAREVEQAIQETEFQEPGDRIKQLTEEILTDMTDQKTDLEQLQTNPK